MITLKESILSQRSTTVNNNIEKIKFPTFISKVINDCIKDANLRVHMEMEGDTVTLSYGGGSSTFLTRILDDLIDSFSLSHYKNNIGIFDRRGSGALIVFRSKSIKPLQERDIVDVPGSHDDIFLVIYIKPNYGGNFGTMNIRGTSEVMEYLL